MKVIDSHLHVWALNDERYPMPPNRVPDVPGDVDRLLASMDDAGVDGALIVQPIFHSFDHRYVSAAIAAHPDRFKGMALVNPQRHDAVEQLERLVTEDGYRGVRLNPALGVYGVVEHLGMPPAERAEHFKACPDCQTQHLNDDVGRTLYAKAGELGIPVGFLVQPSHFDQVDDLLTRFPGTTAIIDHFGYCKVAEGPNPDWERLLALARHPQLHVKVSGFVGPSNEGQPHRDTWPMVHDLLSAFGARRLMWGTDFPWIQKYGGYAGGAGIIGQIPDISEDDRAWLLGGTAAAVFGDW